MRIERYVSRTQNDCAFELSNPVNDGKNFFSILVGENGVGKSQLLRDIFMTVFNSMVNASLFDDLGVVDDSTGRLTLLPHVTEGFSWPPPQIIALSGVATDKFPNKRSLVSRNRSKFDSSYYLYCGPKSENGMVSRNLSERQLHVEILRNMHHAAVRGKAIGAAFELFPQAKGAIFRAFYDDKVGRRPPSSIDQLKKRLDAFIADDASPKSTMANVDPSVAEELVELYDNADFLPTCLTVLREQRGVSWTLLSNGTFDGTLSEIERTALRVLGTLRLLKMRGALLLPREEPLSFDALSSGQWQVLSSILLVAFAVRDDALVLVDEPENSLHPAWQQKYLPTLVNAMAHVRGAHVVVATHSPLVAASIHPDIGSVCAVKRTLTGRVHAELLSRTTFGWSADDILQEVFGLASSRSINFRQDLDGALKLIGQGEIHSKKLDRILTRLNIATAGLPEMDTVREVVATMNALAAERE